MHWKYHIETGDAVQFQTTITVDGDDKLLSAWGTVNGWIKNDVYTAVENDELGFDEFDLEDLELRVKSGQYAITVTLDEVQERTKKDDRKTDLPDMSEEFRFSSGIRDRLSTRDIDPSAVTEVSKAR